MKNIILAIQHKLTSVSNLKYIDKDWGQLQYDNPPIKSPCALIDIPEITYTQKGNGCQQAEATITITLADIPLIRTSANAPHKHNAHQILDLLNEVHQQLQLFSNNQQFSPLLRVACQKVSSNRDFEAYTLTYRTAFHVPKTTTPATYIQLNPIILK